MNAQPNKAVPRKRKSPPRRVPSLIEQRESKPFIFGWGAHLSHREREGLKERVALWAGIGLATILVIVLGWGWYQDAIAGPAALRAENEKQIALVGTDTIRMDYFKRFEAFQQNQFNTQLQQYQGQLTTLQQDSKHAKQNAGQISKLQGIVGQLQQELGSLPRNSLTTLINNQVILQRYRQAGITETKKDQAAAMTTVMKSSGGRLSLESFIRKSGLSDSEFRQLVIADDVKAKLRKKLAANVSHIQTKARASHILIPAKKQALAQQLLQRVRHGADFGALAKKYSTDPQSAKSGGDLGFFTKGAMVPEFDKAVFSMKTGDIRLVKSSYGWHIIKKTGSKTVRLTPTEYQQQQQNAFATWLAQEQAKIHVQRFIAPESLPNPATSSSLASTIPGQTSGQLPSSQVQPQQLPQQAPPVQAPANGKTTKASKPKH